MSADNVEVVKRIFKGVETRDLNAYLSSCSDDVVIREPESLPYGGEYRGRDGVVAHATRWIETWGALQPEPEDQALDATFLDAGDHVIARWTLKARRGEETMSCAMSGAYRLRAGRVVEAQMFYGDTSPVLTFLEKGKGHD